MLTKNIAKYIQSLSHKKFRDEAGVFIAEGPKVVSEFLQSAKYAPLHVCAMDEWLAENEGLLRQIPTANIHVVDDHWLSRISQLKTPNKVLGVFEQNNKPAPVPAKKLSIMLDDLQDPGNMGTIIRIADWFAIENIICSAHSVEQYNPKVVQSTMGSLCRVNIHYTDLLSFIHAHDKVPVYATALEGRSVFETGKITEGIVLIGNESNGLSHALLQVAHHKITIPRFGHAESLNAAVATGIILSHLK